MVAGTTPAILAGECVTTKQFESPLKAKSTRIDLIPIGAPMRDRQSDPAKSADFLSTSEKEKFGKAIKTVDKIYSGSNYDFSIGWRDINSDGVPDIFIRKWDSGECGTRSGCPFHILVSQKDGTWKEMFHRMLLDPPRVLSSKRHGYNDLEAGYDNTKDGGPYVVKINRFDGVDYSPLYITYSEVYKDLDIDYTWANPFVYELDSYRYPKSRRLLNLR